MHRLYRLQQRLAITTSEASAILFFAAVLLTGFVAQHVQSQSPYDAETYAALHADFAERSAAPVVAVADSTEEEAGLVVAASTTRRSSRAKETPVRMNLNTASARLLQRLPRVGPKMAERIIAYREAHGPFARASHIQRVRGIGSKTFEKMEPYLFVEEPGSDD